MELLQEFRETVDHIIANQEILNVIEKQTPFFLEREALLKTQESLKARLTFLNDLYTKKKNKQKREYTKESSLLERLAYLSKISHLTLKAPFPPLFTLRKHRLRKVVPIKEISLKKA